jgi:vacuolar protein sorting-associated protein 54
VCVCVCVEITIVCLSSALASRCLQLVVHYIPVIRAHFETKLAPKQYSVLRHFDHITKVSTDIHRPARMRTVL